MLDKGIQLLNSAKSCILQL